MIETTKNSLGDTGLEPVTSCVSCKTPGKAEHQTEALESRFGVGKTESDALGADTSYTDRAHIVRTLRAPIGAPEATSGTRICAECGRAIPRGPHYGTRKFCGPKCNSAAAVRARWSSRSTQISYPASREEMKTAHRLMQQAIRRGYIIRPATCQVCGEVARVQACHVDYSRPYFVAWCCGGCHSRSHNNPALAKQVEGLARDQMVAANAARNGLSDVAAAGSAGGR